jgi:hypothetical protein
MENLAMKTLLSRVKQLLVVLSLVMMNVAPLRAQVINRLIPKEIVLQHAGSIGYFSAGAGYHLFKKQNGTLDFMYGFVPEAKGGPLHIITTKFAYHPFEIKLKKAVKFYPVNPGLFISYSIHKDLNVWWDKDQYPKGYYWWSPAIRPHVSLSNELRVDTKKLLKHSGIKAIRIYSEFNSNELYLISHFESIGGLKLKDVVKLGLGIRVEI